LSEFVHRTQIRGSRGHNEKVCVIGNGVAFDLELFFQEIEELKCKGVRLRRIDNRILVSKNVHLVMPYHKAIERLEEERRGNSKIGTTLKGIGPAYLDKIGRRGIRLIDLFDEKLFRSKIEENFEGKKGWFKLLSAKELSALKEHSLSFLKFKKRIAPFMIDATCFLNEAIKEKKDILFEGAQGTLLDIDFGTYPYVTSSNTTAGGACTGLGVSPVYIDEVIGVSKAYTTRVGNGPFPTELKDKTGKYIQEKGNEFGATTGRPRRCGWLDLLILRYSVMINGIKKIALTKLDVLDQLDPIRVCVGYKYKGGILKEFSTELKILEKCKPVYKNIPGWEKDTTGIRDYKKLPQKTKDYIKFIEDQTETKIFLISTGCKREETIWV
jgi:adenylosuccinate synthase